MEYLDTFPLMKHHQLTEVREVSLTLQCPFVNLSMMLAIQVSGNIHFAVDQSKWNRETLQISRQVKKSFDEKMSYLFNKVP